MRLGVIEDEPSKTFDDIKTSSNEVSIKPLLHRSVDLDINELMTKTKSLNTDLEQSTARLDLYDFAGQFIFHATHPTFEPTHEILAPFVLRKLILQIRMRSHPVGLDVWFFVWPFVYFHSSCVRTKKALVRLRRCAGSPEPSLVAYAISTTISWFGSFLFSMAFLHFNFWYNVWARCWQKNVRRF